MGGETDLAAMLRSLRVARRDGVYTFVTVSAGTDLGPDVAAAAAATVAEAEGRTLVMTVADAERAGLTVGFRATWLTLTVHSALEAVGLTAAVSRALADAGIPCNVLAGYHHDHLLVPVERADEAVTVLAELSAATGA